MKNIGRTVRKARTKARLSQADLAKKLGFKSPQAISNCERGIATLSPKHFTVLSIATRTPKRTFINAAVRDYRIALLHGA